MGSAVVYVSMPKLGLQWSINLCDGKEEWTRETHRLSNRPGLAPPTTTYFDIVLAMTSAFAMMMGAQLRAREGRRGTCSHMHVKWSAEKPEQLPIYSLARRYYFLFWQDVIAGQPYMLLSREALELA